MPPPMIEDLASVHSALSERYAVEREIGRGGTATVYAARDLRHERRVAIKVLRPAIADAVGVERFLAEIRVTARLEHPHILPLLDSGETRGILYYVMPLVDGETLRDRLEREPQLPLDVSLRMVREVAEALNHAHRRAIVHRDVKPENIFLSDGLARVGDFGIARALGPSGGSRLTGAGSAIGTIAYMSPEQAAGVEAVDARTDIYSLGCVLFEMLAGRPPFTGPSAESVARQHLAAEPPRITHLRPAVPEDVADAIARALAKVPADRFSQAREFADALEVSSGSTRPRGLTITGAASHTAGRPEGVRSRRTLPFAVAGVALMAVLVTATMWLTDSPGDAGESANSHPASGAAFPRRSIAVLPFENLSPDPGHAYLASGLHDEILTQLSRVPALHVISRTSVMRYAASASSIREIADQLRVGSVVEGTVQVVDGTLRVRVQLIDAATDTPLWANRYDGTLDEAFEIQSDVARQIVTAVDARLSEAEASRMAEAPTADPEAYRLYLQAREYELRPARLQQDFQTAQQLYERATAIDPDFALAYASLAELHALTHLLRFDPTPARLRSATAAAETAIRLAPDMPRVQQTGWIYGYAEGDFQRSLAALERAARGLPGDARLRQRIGFAHRVLGRWDEALAAFERSTEMDPFDADLFLHLGITQDLMKRYPEAVSSQERALSLVPDLHAAAVARGWAYARWQGQLDTLAAALARLPPTLTLGPLGDLTAHRPALHLLQRNPRAVLDAVGASRSIAFEWELAYRPFVLYSAWAHRLRGDTISARVAFDSALSLLDARLTQLPDDWRAMASRGLAHAGLGDRAAAMRDARELDGGERHRLREGGYLDVQISEDRARILAQAGEPDAAIDELEHLLRGPSWLSPRLLRLDPIWDPIRSHPDFQALIRG